MVSDPAYREVGVDGGGQPWAGRALPPAAFEGDTGAADPAVLAVLDAVTDGTVDETRLMAALAQARLLVPVVATAADLATGGGASSSGRVEQTAEMAVVTLTAPGGQRGMPVFSGLAALAAWDPAARPVPVTSAHAAQAVVAEGCDVLLLDLGSPHAQVLRPSMVWALAQRRAWLPAHEDPFVREAVQRAAAGEPDVVACQTGPGPTQAPATLTVTLTLAPGLDQEQVQALATRVAERLATDGETRARIDGLSFRLQADGSG